MRASPTGALATVLAKAPPFMKKRAAEAPPRTVKPAPTLRATIAPVAIPPDEGSVTPGSVPLLADEVGVGGIVDSD